MCNKLKIGFIGAGKVGFSLGKFLAERNVQMTGYYSRHLESAQEAANFTGTIVYDELERFVRDTDAIFLTVPDGEITKVYRELLKYDITDKMICHCSGALSSEEAFPGLENYKATGYSIHPLFPISSKYESYKELSDAFFCLEGEKNGIKYWEELFTSFKIQTRTISAKEKTKYHCSCVMASNLVIALLDESISLLTDCGFTKEEAQKALTPLIRTNIEHVLSDGTVQSLTGPLERGDGTTISKHLGVLDKKEVKDLYMSVSRRLISVAEQKNRDRDYTEIRRLLTEKPMKNTTL